ncbi:hypothetical protein P691DRAFT_801654 [Macrolepiota fuliginosa MF-IS2]|uniref:Zn(2)-C6 fungal-type domain-containing protein n=1 Tax=Macrolepiota fuliginosa MF-IS2 TaxID=1400762 RepID=A0A9P5XD41_9AGAR|nr:hypothetical protein P691DRAFT_801654 [Macrolepiota fuliginosa MF-IS2]
MASTREHDDIYSPFRFVMPQDEIPSSSEDGSGLHSPVGGVFPQMPQMPLLQGGGEFFRYQHDPQVDVSPTTEILAPQFDFAQGLNKNQQQQIPILDTRLEPPNSSARQVTFSPYNHPPRYHLGHNFPTQYPSVSSRIPTTAHVASAVNFRFIPTPSGQPSSGGPSHDHTYYQQPPAPPTSANMEADHRPSPVVTPERTEPSISNAANTSRETRKGITPVVIACRLCRARKIRCDSTRPECNNCLRRNNECEYDAMPKRRGPDKRPGTRQRRCKKRAPDDPTPPNPKRRRTIPEPPTEAQEVQSQRIKENMSDSKHASPSPRHPDRPADLHIETTTLHASPNLHRPPPAPDQFVKQEESPTIRRDPAGYGYNSHSPFVTAAFPRSIDLSTLPDEPHRMFTFPTSPIDEARQREWWDRISEAYGPQDIINQVNFLRHNTTHQLSFVNIGFLATNLYDDVERIKVQPAFILAILALAQLLRSSNADQGTLGMTEAIKLRIQAQGALDEARHAGLLNADLAKAQFLLAVFESSAYTEYSYSRASAALHAMDEVIAGFPLTTNDAGDPAVSSFTRGSVPTVYLEDGPPLTGKVCKCLPHEANDASKDYASRIYHLPWHTSWSPAQNHDEEIRRLCWAALSLISEHTAQCMALGRDVPSFYLTNPGHFALLFPGEASDRLPQHRDPNDPLLVKESVWALYCRSMLLWNFCVSVKENHVKVDDKIEAFTDSVGEAQLIEDALRIHRCNLDTTIMYLTREYLFNIRLLVAHEVRVSVVGLPRSGRPGILFNTKHVEEWVRSQQGVLQRVKNIIHQLGTNDSNELIRQPFIVSWFMNQLHIAVLLWPYEQSMVGLLELAKELLFVVDTLNALWTCPENHTQTEELRAELINACHTRGVAPPLPATYVPSAIRTNTY